MADFREQDLSGSRFERVNLRGATFVHVNLDGAELRSVDLNDVTIRGAEFHRARLRGVELVDVEISGEVENVVVNGVEIGPLIDAELNRRMPDRAKMRPTDPDGFRAAWSILEGRWEATIARARTFPEEALHRSVDGEWSFIQTLRHLVFATDSWIRRAIQGDPFPYDDLGLPFTEMEEIPGIRNDVDARPSLDHVLALRADRMASVSEVIAGLTDEQLAGSTEPVTEVGYPESESFPVRRCLAAIMIEEWEHNQFANRDLAALEAG
jgi:hypothetical protein